MTVDPLHFCLILNGTGHDVRWHLETWRDYLDCGYDCQQERRVTGDPVKLLKSLLDQFLSDTEPF